MIMCWQRFISFVGIFAIVLNSVCFEITDNPPKVTLPHGGILVGSYLSSVNDKTFESFRGIPYAKPPVDELRFQAPEPAPSWSGERLATTDAEVCPQKSGFFGVPSISGNEDCLYLNVYRPQNPTNNGPLSVMVFIHGGGFTMGGGSSVLIGPHRFLDHDTIFVAMNYRLGALGFLSTGTAECPGNNGLKDQCLALKWVQENIEAFGGNPNDVTLFGGSAGAASVNYQMISPLSKGLFHKAIIQSGSSFRPWAFAERLTASSRAKKLATLLNCTAGCWKQKIECMRTKLADDIVSAQGEFLEWAFNPVIAFPPTVEGDFKGAFLTKRPGDIAISHGTFMPVIIGVTAEDGILRAGGLLNRYFEEFKSKYFESLPSLLFYESQPENIRKKITSKVDDFYFHGKHDWSNKNPQDLINLISDNWFYSGMDMFLQNRFNSGQNIGTTFVYLYDHKGSTSLNNLYNGVPEYFGVAHGDDAFSLFYMPNQTTIGEGNDAKMKWGMPQMWVDFAQTGNPTPEGSTITKWEPATKFPLQYAHLGRKTTEDWTLLKNEVGLAEERLQFWRDLKSDLQPSKETWKQISTTFKNTFCNIWQNYFLIYYRMF